MDVKFESAIAVFTLSLELGARCIDVVATVVDLITGFRDVMLPLLDADLGLDCMLARELCLGADLGRCFAPKCVRVGYAENSNS